MPPPVSKLFVPSPALAGCVFGAIYRDTRGARLVAKDRVNHFPASPLVTVTRVIHGSLIVLPAGSKNDGVMPSAMAPSLFVTGPQDGPIASWSPDEVTAISIGVYHDAWLHLGGDPEFKHVPNGLANAIKRFEATVDPEHGWHAFRTRFEEVWEQQRPQGWPGTPRISDWARATMTRAALTGPGRSIRSLERRLKRISGQTRRSLDFYAAFENLHQIASSDADRAPADVAIAAGYSDQSHMGRAVRRATGFSPARLNRAIQTEEPFWCYRLLGERF